MVQDTKHKPQCGLILENGNGEILLQLRDNNPQISYPDCWGTFGGQIENGESPAQAIIREIKEELGYDLSHMEYFGNFPFHGYDIYMFYKVDPCVCLKDLTIKEGQRGEFFAWKKTKEINFAFNCREIVEAYFRTFKKT